MTKIIDLEKRIVAEALQNARDLQDTIFSEVEPGDFATDEARKSFLLASDQYYKDKVIDQTILETRTTDEKVIAFMRDCLNANFGVTYEQLQSTIAELKKWHRCRDAESAILKTKDAIKNGDESAILDLQMHLENATSSGDIEVESMSDAIDEALYRLGDKQSKSITTGYRAFDKNFRMLPGRIALLAAETGGGKSALAVNLALNVARTGGAVLYVSLEMTAPELVTRMIANYGAINLGEIQSAKDKDDYKTLEAVSIAGSELKDLKIDFCCRVIPVNKIRTLIKRTRAKYGKCDLVIVDYLQLLYTNKNKDTREREVAEISRTLKAIAQTENTCILALSQVNRQRAQRGESELYLYDIRESAAPTHDADAVFLLFPFEKSFADKYKLYYDVQDDDQDDDNITQMILKTDKCRNGQTGFTRLVFDRSIQRITDKASDK